MGDAPDESSRAFRAAVESHRAGDLDSAAQAYRDILSVFPDHAGALHLLGVINGQLGDHWAALDLIRRALKHDCRSPEAHHNLGFNLERLGDFAQASESYRRALAIKPDYLEARNNLGNVLGELGRWSEAIEQYQRILSFEPDHAPAYNNLGNALLNQRRIGEAIEAYRRTLELNPAHSAAHSNLLFARNHDPDADAEQLFAEHESWATVHAPPIESLAADHASTRQADRRLRIGYVSGDFWQHAASAFFEALLENHDRRRVEIFCYSNHYRVDEVTRRLQEKSDHWAAIMSESDALAADRIRHDKIDILVDLSGHTARNRLKLFALKPAPLQVTWLGYPNTTGLRAIDYRVTDGVADPHGRADRLHTERLARLNRCFLCYHPPDDAPAVGPIPARTAGRVTFGSFNNLTKLTSGVVRLWSGILSLVSGSRLFLKARQMADERIWEELIAQFFAQGIMADRLWLCPTIVSRTEHLAAYSRVDIGLDTFPYNGTTTTCEALWMGVPVVSLEGSCHAGRVGSSLLKAAGLDELIVLDEESYVRRAAGLAQDQNGLARFRAGVREQMRRSELCDGPAFAAAMENVFREMWLAPRNGATRRSGIAFPAGQRCGRMPERSP